MWCCFSSEDGEQVAWSSGESDLPRLLEKSLLRLTLDLRVHLDSLALGIKMNILLFVPGLAVLLVQYQGIKRTIGCLGLIALVQVSLLHLVFPFQVILIVSIVECRFPFHSHSSSLHLTSPSHISIPPSISLVNSYTSGVLIGTLLGSQFSKKTG